MSDAPRPRLARMKKRREFLAAARGRKWAADTLVLQARDRRAPDDAEDAQETRIGFTCSRKVGNAVARNRAKRRLRAAADRVLPGVARPGWDYVLIGRAGTTAAASFDTLLTDLETALGKVHAPRAPR